MLSAGLDLHKRYSQVEAIEESGQWRRGGRVGNEFEEVESFFRALGEPCRVVLEAGWNWGLMYDWLERVENVVEVQLAHPYGETLGSEIKQTEKLLEQTLEGDRRLELLRTIPGLGILLATVVAIEVDRIERFARPAKLPRAARRPTAG